jgi:hypothetical protein
MLPITIGRTPLLPFPLGGVIPCSLSNLKVPRSNWRYILSILLSESASKASVSLLMLSLFDASPLALTFAQAECKTTLDRTRS